MMDMIMMMDVIGIGLIAMLVVLLIGVIYLSHLDIEETAINIKKYYSNKKEKEQA